MSSDVPLPISFEDDKKDQYRGTTAVASRALEQNILNLQSDKMSGKNASQSAQTQQFGGKSQEIVTLVMDEAGVQTKFQKGGTENIYALKVTEAAPETQVFNEVSSFAVPNMDESAVIAKLDSVLSAYSDEIDFTVDAEKNEIKNGVAFINNYYSVFFTFWTAKESDNSVRFEFRRQSGDALASAKFLGDIKTKFFGSDSESSDSKENEPNSLISLELNTDGMAELKVNEADKEMMMIHEALIEDDMVGDSLEEDAENYLYQKLVENKAIDSKDAIDHEKLCAVLMKKDLLLHRDVAVVRAALLILAKFVSVYGGQFKGKALYELLARVMGENKCKIVKRYCVQLLSVVAGADLKVELAQDLKASLYKEISAFEGTEKESYKKFDGKVYANVYNGFGFP